MCFSFNCELNVVVLTVQMLKETFIQVFVMTAKTSSTYIASREDF